MTKEVRSTKIYNVIAAIIFLVGTGSFAYMGVINWLPPLAIIIGLAITVRQLLLGYHLDALVALVLFGSCFFASFLTFFSRVFLPTFLMLGAFYYIARQFISVRDKLVVKATDVHIESTEKTEKEQKHD